MYSIIRDGKTIISGLKTEIEVLQWFHKHTNQSVEWMCKYEGYSVKAVN